jgi:hypothetical protein
LCLKISEKTFAVKFLALFLVGIHGKYLLILLYEVVALVASNVEAACDTLKNLSPTSDGGL